MSLMTRLCVPFVALGFGVLVVALPGGCSRKVAGKPSSVRGAVTFQGKPLVGGLVVFSPDPDRGHSGKSARGTVGADGRYALRLGQASTIPAGWYRVSISAAPPVEMDSVQVPTFPLKLARPDMSGLLREVKHDQENVFEFAIEVPVVVASTR